MRVVEEVLPPGVQDCDHTGLGAEMLGVGGDDADCSCRRLEQDVIEDCLVLQGDRPHRCGHGEDEVEVGNRQQLGLSVGKPLRACQALALGTVPVAAGVVGDPGLAAVLAPLDVTTERRRPAYLDGGHDATLSVRETVALFGAKRIAVAAEDVRHLQPGAHETRSIGRRHRETQAIERAGRPGDQVGGDLGIARSRR